MNFEQIYKKSKLKENDEFKKKMDAINKILTNYDIKNYLYFLHYIGKTKQVLYKYMKPYNSKNFKIYDYTKDNITLDMFANIVVTKQIQSCYKDEYIIPVITNADGTANNSNWNNISKLDGQKEVKTAGSEVLNSLADAIGGQ